jgi:hypothetical protein
VPRTGFVGFVAWPLALLLATAGCGGDKVVHLGNGKDGGRCSTAGVAANEVLWIGDSWILVPGNLVTDVRDLARVAGAIARTDDYVVGAEHATTMATIATQYEARQAGSIKVKVLILDGGTWETINSMGSAMSVMDAANAFTALLANVASDGTVQHVIYFLPPELPAIYGVAALRPLVRAACEQSTVPCHFLDLQPLWVGHPEYTMTSNGILPTEAGATVLADAIWALMQQNCIAQ